MCGTKADLNESRAIEYDDAKKFAKSNNMTYFEVSSKTGDGVEEMFMAMG